MEVMFAHCFALTNLDVSGFNTANVETFNGMFERCEALETVDVSGFDTLAVSARLSQKAFSCCLAAFMAASLEWKAYLTIEKIAKTAIMMKKPPIPERTREKMAASAGPYGPYELYIGHLLSWG